MGLQPVLWHYECIGQQCGHKTVAKNCPIWHVYMSKLYSLSKSGLMIRIPLCDHLNIWWIAHKADLGRTITVRSWTSYSCVIPLQCPMSHCVPCQDQYNGASRIWAQEAHSSNKLIHLWPFKVSDARRSHSGLSASIGHQFVLPPVARLPPSVWRGHWI